MTTVEPSPTPTVSPSPTPSFKDCGIQGCYDDTLSTFAVALGISAVVGVLLLCLFFILRKKFKRFYTARIRFLPHLATKPLPDTWLSWLWPFVTLSDDIVAEGGGLDVYMSLQMYKIGVVFFGIVSVLACGVLLPIYRRKGTQGLVDFSENSISNLANNSNYLWVPFIFMWLISFLLMYILHVNYNKHQQMHYHWLQSGQPHGYTVVVQSVPELDRNDDSLSKTFNFIFPGSVHSVSLYKYVKEHRKLVREREQIRSDLERAYWDLGKKHERPTMRVGGFLCYGGTIVDSIDYLQDQLKEYNQLVKESKYDGLRYPYGTGFVTFKNFLTASLAASSRLSDNSSAYSTDGAPEPTDVYWPNLRIQSLELTVRTICVKILTFAMVVFFAIPVAFLQSFVTIENFQKWFPSLEDFFNDNAALTAAIKGFLPALILNILMFVIPHLMRLFAILEGQQSFSQIEFSRMNKIYYFNVFNVYLASLFGSSFVQISSVFEDLITSPLEFLEALGVTIPSTASFFINYIMVKIFITMQWQLLDVIELLITSIKLWFFARTPRERLSAMKPDMPEFAFFASDLIMVYLLGLCFAVIAPLLSPFALLYMAWGYWVRRYQLLYVRVPKFESGGRFWNLFFSRICISLGIAQVTAMGILLVMEFWPAPALLLLCVLTAIFYSVEEGWYNSDSMPLLLAQDVDEDRTDIDGDGGLSFLREDAYVHPSLKTPDTIAPEEDMVAMEQVHKRWLKQIRPIDSRANVGGRKSVDMYRRKHGPRESAMSRHSNTPAFSDDFNVLPDVHETKNKDNRERNGLLLNTSSESAQLQAPESHDSPRSGDELSIQASNDNATKKED